MSRGVELFVPAKVSSLKPTASWVNPKTTEATSVGEAQKTRREKLEKAIQNNQQQSKRTAGQEKGNAITATEEPLTQCNSGVFPTGNYFNCIQLNSSVKSKTATEWVEK